MSMSITSGHLAGIIVTLTGVTLVGLYAGRRVKSARDFQIGSRRASTAVVAGAIMGTLVGGSSTIGTAQMAFKYGLCAWWFTLVRESAAPCYALWPAGCVKCPCIPCPNTWGSVSSKAPVWLLA